MIRITKKYLVLADQALYSGVGFVSTIWLARHLSPESFGEFSAWVLGIYLAVAAIGAWIMQPFQIRYGQAGDSRGYIAFVCTWQVLLLAGATLVVGMAAIVTQYANIRLALIYGLGFILYDFIRKLLLVLNRVVAALALNIVSGAINLATLAWLTLSGAFNLTNVVFGFSIGNGVVFVLGLALLGHFKREKATSASHFSYHIREGKWFFLTAISQWWSGNLYVVASGVFLGPVALGALRLSQSLFGVLNVLLQTFENYILPQTAQRMRMEYASGIAYLKNITLKAGWVFIPVLLAVFLLGEPLLTLAGGARYANYGFVLQGLSLLYVLIYLSQPLRCIIRSLELNRAFFQGYLITMCFALAFSRLLLSEFGLYGVIAGLIFSQTILMLYWSRVLHVKNRSIWKSFISF